MNNIERINQKWAMEPTQLQAFLSSNEKVAGDPYYYDGGPSAILSINGNTAIILVHGILTSRVYQNIHQAIQEVKRSALIKNIILDINSPGGSVAPGLDQVWQALFDLRNKGKSVIAVNTGMMASGSYWIASAANSIFSVGELTMQGSIGVFAGLVDTSEAEKNSGIKRIRLVSRNAALKNLPVNDPQLIAQLQEDLDHVESVFVSRIATGRGISTQRVINDFGKGALVTTPSALRSGMIDGIVPMDEVLKDPGKFTVKTMAVSSQQINQTRTVEERILALKAMKGHATAEELDELQQLRGTAVSSEQAHTTQQAHTERTVAERVDAIKRLDNRA